MNTETSVPEAPNVAQKSAIEKKFDDDINAALTKTTDADRLAAKDICTGTEQVCMKSISAAGAVILYRMHNGKNRALSIPKTRDYAAAMTRGEWKTTHQGYAFDKQGNIVDGQNRLAAQALSGVTLNMVVYRNADRSMIDAIDLAKPRKAHEALAIAGILNAGEKERISRAAMEYSAKVAGQTAKPTLIQVEQYVTHNDESLQVAIDRGRHSLQNIAEPCLSETVASLVAYLMHLGDWPTHLIPSFLTTLQAGVDQKENGVIVPTAKIMIAAKRKEKKLDALTRDQQISTILRAAKHWARGESVARFKASKKTELADFHADDLVEGLATAA